MAMEQSPLYRKVARAPNAVFFGKWAFFYRLFFGRLPTKSPAPARLPYLPYLINYPKREVFYDLTV